MASLVLIRHEISEANEKKIYGGKSVGLSEKGKNNAKRLEEEIQKLHLTDFKLYVSEYKRAKETASLALPASDFIVMPLVNELDFGDFIGRTFEDNYQCYKEDMDRWLQNPLTECARGGESYQDVMKRAGDFLELVKNDEKDSVVFTHAGFIQAMLAVYFKDDMMFERKITNGEIIILDLEKEV